MRTDQEKRQTRLFGSGKIKRKAGKGVLHTTEQLCEASRIGSRVISDTPTVSFSISKSVCHAVVRCVEAVEFPKVCYTKLLHPAAAVWL